MLSGTDKDNFFSAGKSQKGTPFNEVTLNVKANMNTTVYGIKVKGYIQENVYYKIGTANGGTELKTVPWADRDNKNLIASSLGEDAELSFKTRVVLEKNKDGQNIEKDMVAYDAAQYIKKLKDAGKVIDGTPVTVSGKIVMSRKTSVDATTGEKTTRKYINLEPTGIYLSREVDLAALDEKQARTQATFDMEVIVKEFYELENKTYMKAIVVGYDFIEEMEFQFQEPKLAKTFKTLKPYTMIRVKGAITSENNQEKIEEDIDDPWCSGDEWKKVTGGSRIVYVIGKGEKDTIDTETYTKEAVEEAIERLVSYQEDYKAGETVEISSTTEELDFGTDEFGDLSNEFD